MKLIIGFPTAQTIWPKTGPFRNVFWIIHFSSFCTKTHFPENHWQKSWPKALWELATWVWFRISQNIPNVRARGVKKTAARFFHSKFETKPPLAHVPFRGFCGLMGWKWLSSKKLSHFSAIGWLRIRQGCEPTRERVECWPHMVSRVVLVVGVPLVGLQEELRGPSRYTPRGFTSGPKREAIGFYNKKQKTKQTKQSKQRLGHTIFGPSLYPFNWRIVKGCPRCWHGHACPKVVPGYVHGQGEQAHLWNSVECNLCGGEHSPLYKV